MKLCKECKYYLQDTIGPDCTSPLNPVSFITGDPSREWATSNRMNETKCGGSARWFEPRVYKSKISWFKKMLGSKN